MVLDIQSDVVMSLWLTGQGLCVNVEWWRAFVTVNKHWISRWSECCSPKHQRRVSQLKIPPLIHAFILNTHPIILSGSFVIWLSDRHTLSRCFSPLPQGHKYCQCGFIYWDHTNTFTTKQLNVFPKTIDEQGLWVDVGHLEYSNKVEIVSTCTHIDFRLIYLLAFWKWHFKGSMLEQNILMFQIYEWCYFGSWQSRI